jgi:2',3'-cyclic-nucleotide 2'-phosphodiesterase (5'-nucleotidase family)
MRVTILHTNDEHSHLIPIPAADDHPDLWDPSLGGFARLAGEVKRIRAEKAQSGEPVMMFSGGDILGGPAFGWLPLMDGVTPELSLMQMIGYDAVVIGNHEFDYGTEVLAGYYRDAGYENSNETRPAIMGSNINPPETHPLSRMGIRDYLVLELENGLKAGVFGIIGNDAISKTAHPEPVEFEDPLEAARSAVAALESESVDLIIAVNHAGVMEDRQLARAIPELDVIVSGHSHTVLNEPVYEGNAVIVQAGSYLSHLGVLELSVDAESGEVTVLNEISGRPFLTELDDSFPEDENVKAEVERYRMLLNDWVAELTDGRIERVTQPIAHLPFVIQRNEPRREAAIGNYITDAMKFAAEEAMDVPVDIAVQANGAIRSDIRPGSQEWSLNRVTFYDMMMAVGLGSGDNGNPGYPLVSFYITEDEVRRALEVSVLLSELLGDNYYLQFSGMKMLYDPSRAVLFRIPFTDTPVPTKRAVLSAELDTADDRLERLEKGDENLLHVVTDYYIAGFLPMVGDVVPDLAIELKNENGMPIELDDAIIYRNGSQLKVWQAVLEYTQSFEQGEDGLPVIPDRYSEPEGRQVVAYTLPLWIWPLVVVFIIVSVIIFIIKKR